jgi:methionine synthase reductase
MSDNKYIYILYGSQTGNSENIAKNLENLLVKDNHKIKCFCLNDTINFDFKDSLFTFIICSTTGNGDPPLNAEKWWRFIKNRNIDKNKFMNINYCVLGLGDSNYDKFCYIGKMIDKRISELGGKRIINIFCANEATNMEDVVDSWLHEIRILTTS